MTGQWLSPLLLSSYSSSGQGFIFAAKLTFNYLRKKSNLPSHTLASCLSHWLWKMMEKRDMTSHLSFPKSSSCRTSTEASISVPFSSFDSNFFIKEWDSTPYSSSVRQFFVFSHEWQYLSKQFNLFLQSRRQRPKHHHQHEDHKKRREKTTFTSRSTTRTTTMI